MEVKEQLSAPMTIVGMVNGMIGGLILILPVYALSSGYILTLIIIMVTGVFSYYSCYLCVIHMGDQPDLDYAILRHFNGSRWVKIFYDLCVWLNLILIDILYFQLIVGQWMGLIPPHQFSIINIIVNAIVLFILVFIMKYFEFGSSLMAYGIISIISYLIFLIWVVVTYNQGYNETQFNAFGSGGVTLAAAMGQAFSIQSFFIPVLKKNKNPEKYTFYTMLAYIIGGLAYYYIAYMGSVGIWHRQYNNQNGSQVTIEGYFGANAWEVNLIEAIYLIHLYSVFPQFMLISKKRMFGVFLIKQSSGKSVNIAQIIYFTLMVIICFVVGFFEVNINDIIDINGAVIGFFFIYLIPAVLHIKCLYFSKGKKRIPRIQFKIDSIKQEENQEDKKCQQKRKTEIQIPQKILQQINKNNDTGQQGQLSQALIQKQYKQESKTDSLNVELKRQDRESEPSVPRKQSEIQNTIVLSTQQINNSYFYCDCFLQDYTKIDLAISWIFILVMILLGLFILVNGIYQVAN